VIENFIFEYGNTGRLEMKFYPYQGLTYFDWWKVVVDNLCSDFPKPPF
jgi:hypothetical protein